MHLAYLMIDDSLSVREVFAEPALVAGAACLAICTVWRLAARQKGPTPYWVRALLVTGAGLLIFAILGIFFLPNRPLV